MKKVLQHFGSFMIHIWKWGKGKVIHDFGQNYFWRIFLGDFFGQNYFLGKTVFGQ